MGAGHPAEPYQSLLPLENAVQDWLDQPIGELDRTIPPEGENWKQPFTAASGCPVQPGAVGGDRGGLLLHQPGERPSGAGLSGDYAGGDSAYLFANTLVVLEVTEEVLRQTLERCATYFTLVDGQPQIAEEFLLPQSGALQLRLSTPGSPTPSICAGPLEAG